MKMLEKIPVSLRWVLAPVLFWLVILLGPFVIVFWNWISPYSMEPGTITYLIFSICLQPFASVLACYIAREVAPHKSFTLVVVNGTIACVIHALLLIQSLLGAYGNWEYTLSNVLAIIGIIYICFLFRQKTS